MEGVEISSTVDIVVSNLSTLDIPWGKLGHHDLIRNTCEGINDPIKAFQYEFRFLTMFEDCIHMWSDAGVLVPELVVKIQATIQEIERQVVGEEVEIFGKILMEIREADLFISFLRRNLEWASKILDVFTNSIAKINLLKPEIREGCEKLSGQSFQSHFPLLKFDDWKEFLSRVCCCMEEVGEQYANADSTNFLGHLQKLRTFLHGLPAIHCAQDVSIRIADVTNRAALVLCNCWASQFDPNMEEDLIIALFELQRRSDFTDSEPLDQMVRLLKNLKAMGFHSFKQKANYFVRYFLPFNGRIENFAWRSSLNSQDLTLITEEIIEALIIYFMKNLEIPEEDAEIDQIFFLEFKLLISETKKALSCSSPVDGTLFLSLLAKAWLIKAQVFIIDQLTAGDDFLLNANKEIGSLKRGLQRIKGLPEEHSENVNQIIMLIEEVTKLVPSLHHSFVAEDITKDMVRTALLLLLLKILHFNLDRKLCHNGSSMLVIKDRVQSFLEGLKFLINCFINRKWEIVKDGVVEVARIDVMARRVISIYHSLLTHSFTEDMENMNIMLSDSLDEIKLIMSELREIYLHVPKSNYPETNALGFIDSLLSKLRELLNYKVDLFASVKQHIEEISGNLELFGRFLGDIVGHVKEIEELRDLGGNVIDAAYEAAYLVDSIVSRHRPDCHISIWLYWFLQDIRHIAMKVANVHEKKILDAKVHKVLSMHVLKTSTPRIEDAVLLLSDQQEEIIARLVGGFPQRDTVSIVGMPGVGKTTLAMRVYSSPRVAHHFHVRAWCCVTEVYRKRELLLEILSHIIVLTDNIFGMCNEDLYFKLRQLLLKNKYLIVLDDMWNPEAWYDLQRSFPDDEIGSRILITTRLNHVALKAKAYSDPYHLRLLSDIESWALLQMKIFHEERCPQELIEVGQEIAKNCKGLPLAIVAMAGILGRTERQQNRWKKIAENLSSRIVDDPQEQCREILELSYNLLPDCLQACFLYFGAFLEDQEISVRKLIRLWIAEGFVQKTELKSLEDIAEDYLNDLIGRSLVISAQPRSRGGTKACRVHDMLRSLCQSKATEDNFLQVITRSKESDASSDDLGFIVGADFSNTSNDKTYEGYRLCFYAKRYHFVESRSSGPYAHSLLFFATSDKYGRSSYDVSFICCNFRVLNVLDLEYINMGPSFSSGIEQLVLLRYLAVSGDFESVPSSIGNLWNLETFVVKGLKGKVNLPDTIWGLKKLRHVHISDVAIINLQDNMLGNSSLLDFLVNISSLFLRYGEETSNILTKFPNLRKLGCVFSKSANCSGIHRFFPRFDVLTLLESLKMSYYGRALHTAEFSLPPSLKKLTLSNFRLPWSHISVIGRLQNLEVLKLLSRAYDGETWDMVDGEFCNLKFLKLDSLNITKWNASSDNLPKLRQLVLRNCKHLEEVPDSFIEIPTLQMIEVQWCGNYAEMSARAMREKADEYLKVIITSDLETRSSW